MNSNKRRLVSIKKQKFWFVINSRGDIVPIFGLTFLKKQMVARVGKQKELLQLGFKIVSGKIINPEAEVIE